MKREPDVNEEQRKQGMWTPFCSFPNKEKLRELTQAAQIDIAHPLHRPSTVHEYTTRQRELGELHQQIRKIRSSGELFSISTSGYPHLQFERPEPPKSALVQAWSKETTWFRNRTAAARTASQPVTSLSASQLEFPTRDSMRKLKVYLFGQFVNQGIMLKLYSGRRAASRKLTVLHSNYI